MAARVTAVRGKRFDRERLSRIHMLHCKLEWREVSFLRLDSLTMNCKFLLILNRGSSTRSCRAEAVAAACTTVSVAGNYDEAKQHTIGMSRVIVQVTDKLNGLL